MIADIFEFSAERKRFAVVGNPISHSKSPEIHQIFAQQCSIVLDYEAIHVDHGGFAQALRNLQAQDFSGINITVPFKQNAAELADRTSNRARAANAVNTMKFEDDGSIYGDNTDGEGLLRDLKKNLGQSICGSNVLVVGAGGAARGILEPLLAAKPETVVVTNRTAKRAISIANEFLQYGSVQWQPFDQIGDLSFDEDLLDEVRRLVELNCKANSIPEKLEYDLIESEIGDSVKISDINLPEDVQPTITDRDFVIATLAPPTVEIEEETKTEDEGEEGEGEGAESEAKDEKAENKDKKEENKEEKKEASPEDKSK